MKEKADSIAQAGLKVPRVWEGAVVRVPKEYHSKDKMRRENWEWIRRYLERNGLATPVRSSGPTGQADTHPSEMVSEFHGASRVRERYREIKAANYLIRGVDIWKMKVEWLVELGGMVLMVTHPDYLCHPKLVRSRQKGVGSRYDGWLGGENRRRKTEVTPVESPSGCSSRSNSTGQGGWQAKHKYIYDGWLGSDDRDVVEVRDKEIVVEKWYGSLLEQYAAFLSWFKREFEGQYWHGLAREIKEIRPQ